VARPPVATPELQWRLTLKERERHHGYDTAN
jgi:hypothetical protein